MTLWRPSGGLDLSSPQPLSPTAKLLRPHGLSGLGVWKAHSDMEIILERICDTDEYAEYTLDLLELATVSAFY